MILTLTCSIGYLVTVFFFKWILQLWLHILSCGRRGTPLGLPALWDDEQSTIGIGGFV